MHWFIFILFYQTVYQFELPNALETIINVVAGVTLVLTTLSMGPLAVRWSQAELKTWVWGGVVGAGAGCIVGIITYLAIGALASTLFFGVVPFIPYAAAPAQLVGVDLNAFLRPILQNAISGVYSVEFNYISFWLVVGGIEGIASALLHSWRSKLADRVSAPEQKTQEVSG